MTNLTCFRLKFCFSLIAIISMVSCGGSRDKNAEGQHPDTTKPAAPPATAASTKLTGITTGYIDTLYMDAKEFYNLDKEKLVFKFVFADSVVLILHGWLNKDSDGHEFPTNPTVQLKKWGTAHTQLLYGIGTYFGNEILTKQDVGKVQTKMKNEKVFPKYLLFAPSVYSNQIEYELLITKDEPNTLTKTSTSTTGANTNPSPPKNY